MSEVVFSGGRLEVSESLASVGHLAFGDEYECMAVLDKGQVAMLVNALQRWLEK